MPKKFVGENSKATEARVRKAAVKKDEADRKKQSEEDESWQDDHKLNQRKVQRKEELERKRHETVQRKQALKQAHDEEMDTIAGGGAEKIDRKVTRAQLDAERERIAANRQIEIEQQMLEAKKLVPVDDKLALPENVNRLQVDGETARTVDEAIFVLGASTPEIDRHPEKRMRAAYQAYEDANIPRMKLDHPTLRLSQLKQLLKRDWQKAPENPLNQRLLQLQQSAGSSV